MQPEVLHGTRDFPQKALWTSTDCESQGFFVALKHILAHNRNLDCMIKTHETSQELCY